MTDDGPELTRRQFLKFGGVAGAALALNEVDKVLGRVPSTLVDRFITDPEFREKALDSLAKGEIVEDVQQLTESRTKKHIERRLGESVDLSETWMDRAYSSIEVFRLQGVDIPEYEERFIVFAQPKFSGPLELSSVQINSVDVPNLTLTARETSQDFVLVPGGPVVRDEVPNTSMSVSTPLLYSAYEVNGQIEEYVDKVGKSRGGRSIDRGAVVVDNSNRLLVLSPEEAKEMRVGNNCKAFETSAYVYDSVFDPRDMFDQLTTESMAIIGELSRYNSVVVTFYDRDGVPDTKIVSRYQHFNENTGETRGRHGVDTLMTPTQMIDILYGYLDKSDKYDRFVMSLPDPQEQSAIVSSWNMTEAQIANDYGNPAQLVNYYSSSRSVPVGSESSKEFNFHRSLTDGKVFVVPPTRKHVIANFGK